MTALLAHSEVAQAFKDACIDELHALKPGNVHIFSDGHDMTVADFERSAIVAAPLIAQTGVGVGRRIRDAVAATIDEVGCNTNLGIILLCAPLVVAASEPMACEPQLRQRLSAVLSGLTVEDANFAFEGISRAKPAGLGSARAQDVHQPASETLLDAMALAANRDRISRAYVTDFADIFDVGLPLLNVGAAQDRDRSIAITHLHMTYLSAFPDSHIVRKHGQETALKIMNAARQIKAQWDVNTGKDQFEPLLKFDAALKQKGLNPGTTADLVVATLFSDRLLGQIASSMSA